MTPLGVEHFCIALTAFTPWPKAPQPMTPLGVEHKKTPDDLATLKARPSR